MMAKASLRAGEIARLADDAPVPHSDSWPARRPPSFDVEAVNIKTGARRNLAEKTTKDNADAIVKMAVARRGVDKEFYEAVPHENAYDRAEIAVAAEARKSVLAVIKMRARMYALAPHELEGISDGLFGLPPHHLVTALAYIKRAPRVSVGIVQQINLRAAMLYARYSRAKATLAKRMP